jgi:hypothetical protein
VDVDDVIIRQHFDKTELDEIDDAPDPQVPELSDEIVEFLNKFSHKVILIYMLLIKIYAYCNKSLISFSIVDEVE